MRFFHFLLLMTVFMNPLNAKEEFEGRFTLTVPGNRQLESLKLGINFSAVGQLKKIQQQGLSKPGTAVQVGVLSKMTVKKNRRGKLRFQDARPQTREAWFYLYARADRVERFFFTPMFASQQNIFRKSGGTEGVYSLYFYAVDRVGERSEERLLGHLDQVSFQVGIENEIPVHLDLPKGKKFAVKMKASGEDVNFVHLAVSKRGEFPFYIQRGDKFIEYFHPPIGFEYQEQQTSQRKRADQRFETLTRDVNTYIRSHSNYGTDQIIEVPIRLKMKLSPENSMEVHRSVVGPPPPPKKMKKIQKEAKQKRVFGF